MNSTDVTAPVMHWPYSWAHKVCLNIIIISVNKFFHYRKSSYFKHIWGGFNRDRVLIWEEERKGLWYQFPIKNKNTKWKMSSTRKERSRSEDKKQVRTSSWWINHPGSVHVKFYSSYWWMQSIIYQWRIIRGMLFLKLFSLKGGGVGGGELIRHGRWCFMWFTVIIFIIITFFYRLCYSPRCLQHGNSFFFSWLRSRVWKQP